MISRFWFVWNQSWDHELKPEYDIVYLLQNLLTTVHRPVQNQRNGIFRISALWQYGACQKPLMWFPEAYHVVESPNKSSSNQRLIPYKVLIGKGITLNAHNSTVHEDHASKINSHIQPSNFSLIRNRNVWNPCTKFKLCGCPVHND